MCYSAAHSDATTRLICARDAIPTREHHEAYFLATASSTAAPLRELRPEKMCISITTQPHARSLAHDSINQLKGTGMPTREEMSPASGREQVPVGTPLFNRAAFL